MNLQPLEDRLVVRPSESEETTASGLVIPDTAKEKPQQGEVLAVGPGKRSETTGEIIPVDVSVGDTVVYSKYGGTEIASGGEDLLILNARDVLAKLVNFWMLILTTAGIYAIGRTACSRLTGIVAAALFCAVPVVAFAAWHTSVELGAAFWTLMGLWSLLRGFHTQLPEKTSADPPSALARWILVSGLFHGLALGVKYTAAWNATSSEFACAIAASTSS